MLLSVDPDVIPHTVASSNLGLHCLLMPPLCDVRHNVWQYGRAEIHVVGTLDLVY